MNLVLSILPKIQPKYYGTSTQIVFVCFFKEWKDIKKTFQNKLLLNFIGHCDLASLKKVHPDNKKSWPENTGQPKSARAFCCLGLLSGAK